MALVAQETESHPREWVDGSDPFYKEVTTLLLRAMRAGGKRRALCRRGSELSTNCLLVGFAFARLSKKGLNYRWTTSPSR